MSRGARSRRWWLALVAGCAALMTAGCAGERPTGRDLGPSVYPDQGPPPVYPDQGGPPPTGGKTCAQILDCVRACTESTCSQACVASGSEEGKSEMAAFDACLQAAFAGACLAQCANPQATECQACAEVACKAEIDTCLRSGAATAGFGEACDLTSPGCSDGLACIDVANSSAGKGLCTKKCPTLGGPCDGAPVGTEAGCILSSNGTHFCAFLCTIPDHTFPCPASTTCATADDPPGSGQRICLP